MTSAREPGERRLGWLKNGNPPGDLSKVRQCGARTRRGSACRCPAMANGRCKLHGGKSTGPRTAAGLEAIRRARTKHGYYSARAIEERRYDRLLLRSLRSLLAQHSDE